MTNVLEEALNEPLYEGPLELIEVPGKQRQLPADIPAPPLTDLPLVSIGRPRLWFLSDLLSGRSLPLAVQASLQREVFFVIRAACSFRPRTDKVKVVWARFVLHLLPDTVGNQPLAYDLYPLLVERERKVNKKVSLNPSIKFQEVEGSLGEFVYTVEYPAIDPVVSAAGAEEPNASWDFSEAPGYQLTGGKLLHIVVSAPKNLQQLAVTASLTADLEYQGFRLSAWLRGDPAKADKALPQTLLWP